MYDCTITRFVMINVMLVRGKHLREIIELEVCVVRPTSKIGASANPRQWPLYYDAGHALIAHQIGNSALTAASPCTRAVDHYSHADNRSILELTSPAYTRACQSERRVPPVPIRTPEWSLRLSGQRRILCT